MADLKNVVYISNENYETLVTTGTVSVNGTTINYDENDLYITPEEPLPTLKIGNVTYDGTESKTVTLADLGGASSGNYVSYTNNSNVSSVGNTKTIAALSPTSLFVPNGLVMGGTAQAAGLVTRGVCGSSEPDSTTGASNKDHLYINYDGNNNLSSSRQMIINAGTLGDTITPTNASESYSTVYQYAAVRGDHIAGYLKKYYQPIGTYLTSQSYRPISVNGTSILAASSTTALNIKSGTNVTVTGNNSGDVIIAASNTAHSHSYGAGIIGSGNAGASGTYTYKAALVDETKSSNASTYTAGGTSHFYATQLDSNGKLATYIPVDTSLSATSTNLVTNKAVTLQIDTLKNRVTTLEGNYVTINTAQTITGTKTFNAPTNVNGSEIATTTFKTSNGGQIIFGKEGPNSGTMIRLDQSTGTCRLRFRASATPGAMVWEQPESGSQLYYDVNKVHFRKSNEIYFNEYKNAGYLYTDGAGLLRKGTMPTALKNPNALTIGDYSYDGSSEVIIHPEELQVVSNEIKDLKITEGAVVNGVQYFVIKGKVSQYDTWFTNTSRQIKIELWKEAMKGAEYSRKRRWVHPNQTLGVYNKNTCDSLDAHLSENGYRTYYDYTEGTAIPVEYDYTLADSNISYEVDSDGYISFEFNVANIKKLGQDFLVFVNKTDNTLCLSQENAHHGGFYYPTESNITIPKILGRGYLRTHDNTTIKGQAALRYKYKIIIGDKEYWTSVITYLYRTELDMNNSSYNTNKSVNITYYYN